MPERDSKRALRVLAETLDITRAEARVLLRDAQKAVGQPVPFDELVESALRSAEPQPDATAIADAFTKRGDTDAHTLD